MYSDAVKTAETIPTKTISTNGIGFYKKSEVYEKWKDWLPSEISHHGQMCCEIAREWIISTDFSELNGGSLLAGPRWLRQKFFWGASSFPIHWCEAVRRKTLDCGALAALAAEVFTARGVKTYRVQMVQRFSEVSTLQWSNSWNDSTEPLCWMNDDLIYHEGCAIAGDADEIKIWDASAGWWADPKSRDGYGALLALRVSDSNLSADANFIWGEYVLDACRWSKVN